MTTGSTYSSLALEDNDPKQDANVVSAVPQDEGTGEAIRLPKSAYKGWRFGVAMGLGVVIVVLIINIVLTIVAATRFSDTVVAGVGTLMEGQCDLINQWSTGLHLVINVLSSLMLSASNYCMQCVAAPTRKDLDRAHLKHRRLDIGVPSVRNILGKIAFSRTGLFAVLALSSIPVHLLFNSAIFKTIDANIYDALVVNESFLDGSAFDTNITLYQNGQYFTSLWYGNTSAYSFKKYGEDTTYPHLRDIQSFFKDNSKNSSAVERLENVDCMARYGSAFVSGRSDLLLVTSEPGNYTNNTFFFYWHSGGDYQYDVTYDWICSGKSWSVGSYPYGQCDVSGAIRNADNWFVNNRKIEYCLSKTTPPRCQLQFSLHILIAVIVCNIIKISAMLWTLFRQREETIVTMGDAIAAFLDKPDETSRSHAWKPASTPTARNKERYWYAGASRDKWGTTLFLCIAALVVAAIYLAKGMSWSTNNAGKSIIQRGFGVLDPAAIVGEGSPQRGTRGLIGAVLVANTPQLIASLLYLAYNGLMTSMLMANEWSRYFLRAKPLRTSTPKGQQRSTYWLSLPFTYSVPLIAASMLLHWLISQSLFLARIVVYDSGTSTDAPGQEASRVGYSCLPILFVILLGLLLLFFAIGTGFRRLEHRMPVVGTNSMKIAAACHPPKGDDDAAYLPVSWGMVETDNVPRILTFTSWKTKEPIYVPSEFADKVESTKPAPLNKYDDFGIPYHGATSYALNNYDSFRARSNDNAARPLMSGTGQTT